MSKKIIMHLISNLNEGGAEISLYQLCLNTPEFEHIVVSMMDEGKFGPMLQREGVRLYCLYMPKGQLTFQSIIHFWRILRCDKPNILQTWMYHADFFGGIIGSIAGIENIIWGIRHGNLTAGTVNNKTFFLAKFCAFLSHFIPKKIVSCSKRAMEAHIAFGYERALITVIPNGCDSSFYSPNLLARMSLRKNWGIESNVFLFGMVARYDTQKDHANLLCALQILRKVEDSFHCILIGTNINYENEQLKGLLAKLGLKDVVTLAGSRNDVPAIMNAIDLHVLSSLGEAFPNVILEAMACGTPCVSTDVGDAAMIVGKTGWIVLPQNSKALAHSLYQAIQEFRFSRKAWNERQFSARERIKTHYSIKEMADSFATLWGGA